MFKRAKKTLTSILLVMMILSAMNLATPVLADTVVDQMINPSQIALSMTNEPTTSISINWTTINTQLTNPKVLVWLANAGEDTAIAFMARAEQRSVVSSTILNEMTTDILDDKITQKNFYTATITGLKPGKEYSYRCGTAEAMSGIRSFKTASESNGAFTFLYFSDAQVDDPHSLAWQANLDLADSYYPDADFIYIAGDLTNTANDEGQWETFFNQPGNTWFNETFDGDLISELPLAAAMGNHDSKNAGVGGMSSHYSWNSEVTNVPVTYAFDYGAARMIILNLENAYSRDNETARNAQVEFLKKEVAEAQAAGKWTFIGFHKSIYSGANHMDDSDVIFNRKFWSPIFAELDVDFVLQGHDHVLSRGFIQENGYALDITRQIDDREYMAKDPENAPLYYVGNTGSSLKFYAPILNNDYIKEGDPVAPDYGYLDINSALPAGYVSTITGKVMNPGPCTNDDLEGVDPDFYRTPTFTSIKVTKGSVEFTTYMTGFNPYANEIVEDTFLYDSLKVTR